MSFTDTVDTFLAGFFRLYPVHATEAGNHDHDGEWPDLTDAGTAERLAFIGQSQERLEAIEPDTLSHDDAIDRRILLDQLAAMRFEEEELREERWSPMAYVYLFGTGLFALLSREFAPLPDRLRSMAARMRALPAALDAARANLENPGDRPVARIHAEKAIQTMPGVADLARTAATEADQLDDAALRDEVKAAAGEAAEAVDRFTGWLRDELLPSAQGDFRLGQDLYRSKFAHALRSTFTPEELEARAQQAFTDVRAEMLRIAEELWPSWVGPEPMPSDPDAVVRRVLDEIANDHPA